ncbi:MAG: gliding motility-associated C-terminal domain-containing protein [Bacteroidia bacterium]|jgi:gliding motility-associated-like protein|nr:gliding motility-associated C-terminal domain-containing protein [Bacteroidia bacterium]
MNLRQLFLLPVLFSGVFAAAQGTGRVPAKAPQGAPAQVYYEKNKNQWPMQVLYKANVSGGAVWLENDRLTWTSHSLADLNRIHDEEHHANESAHANKKHSNAHKHDNDKVRCHAWYVEFEGANRNATVVPEGLRKEYSNYFIGNDRTKWAGNVPRYDAITYQQLYNGISLKAYGDGANFKYDFLLSPGADASVIKLRYNGINVRLTPQGTLLLDAHSGPITEQAPVAWQVSNGQRIPVNCNYVLRGDVLGFEFPDGYNNTLPLVIDPVIVASTYSGSTMTTYGHSATYDLQGHIYSGGRCFGQGYPATPGAYDLTYAGGVDIAISKYNPTGSALLWATYVGGSTAEYVHSMFVHTNEELYIFGSVQSTDYPTTAGCYDASHNGGDDILVTHLNISGSALVGSTYVGGSGSDGLDLMAFGYQQRGEIVVDAAGNACVASSSSSANFPTTPSAFDQTQNGQQDAVVISLNPTMTTLNWSTFVGGTSNESGLGIRVVASGDVFICGSTTSSNLPTTAGTYQAAAQGATDGYSVHLSPNATAITAATYIGTNFNDQAYFLDVDADGDVYIYGSSEGTMPISAGVYSNPGSAMYITKFDPLYAALIYSTVIGDGTTFSALAASAFLVDVCENVYIAGFGAAAYPATANAFYPGPSVGTCYLAVLERDAQSLIFATYYGANHVDGGTSRFDPQGIVYHAVCQGGGGFPVQPNAYNAGPGAGWDVCVFKIDFEAVGTQALADASPSDTGCVPYTVTFDNAGSTGNSYIWDFGDNSPTSTQQTPTHTFTAVGTYTVTLVAIDSSSCKPTDTAFIVIDVVNQLPVDLGPDTVVCNTAPLALSANVSGASYLWSTGATTQNITTTQPGTYWVEVNTASCSARDTIVVTPLTPPDLGNDFLICPGETVQLQPNFPGTAYQWSTGDTTRVIEITQPGTYWLQMSVGPCTVNDTIVVNIGAGGAFQPINVFSPDGDGVNDAFDIGTPSANGFDLHIYDRWGRLMFETTDPTVKWLGDFDQKASTEGVYYWVCTYENCLGETQTDTGFVHIVR